MNHQETNALTPKSSEEKLAAVLDLLKGTLEATVCKRHGVTPEQLNDWAQRFHAGAATVFDNDAKLLAAGIDDFSMTKKVNRAVQLLLNSTPHAVFCKDTEGRFIYGNPTYCDLMHITLPELLGKTDFDLHPPLSARKYRDDDLFVLKSKQVYSVQEKHVHVDGTTIWTEVIKAPLRDKAGTTVGLMGVFWDVTRQKEVEAELSQTKAHLEQTVARRTSELMEANKRLEANSRMKNAFISSVSHELRTPLTSVLGFAKLIGRDARKLESACTETNAPYHRHVERIVQNSEIITHESHRLKRLINAILDLGKMTSGNMQWHDTVTDLNTVARNVLKSMQGQFVLTPRTHLKSDLSEKPPLICADPDRIAQVLINLLNNAGKFTEKGTVTLTTSVYNGKWAQASVADTGSGIPKEALKQIFDQYYQANAVHAQAQGTGLGLSISRQIISHYNGKFWVESKEGKGSTFYIRLPLLTEGCPGESCS